MVRETMIGLSQCSRSEFVCLDRRLFTNIQSLNGLGGSFLGFTLFVGKVVGRAWMTMGQEEVLCPMHPHTKQMDDFPSY